MLSLKRKFRSKRRLTSVSSSTAGSVSDLEDRVVMLCEDIPTENSFDSGRGSSSPGARFSRDSQSEDHESGSAPHIIHLSRDGLSYSQACYVELEPPRAQKEYYIQRVAQVYEYLFKCCVLEKLKCAEFTLHSESSKLSYSLLFVDMRCTLILYALSLCLHVIRLQLSAWQSALKGNMSVFFGY